MKKRVYIQGSTLVMIVPIFTFELGKLIKIY